LTIGTWVVTGTNGRAGTIVIRTVGAGTTGANANHGGGDIIGAL
jgi:hypothetical protein